MSKQPHNEHELELALTRLAGSNLAAVVYRDMMAGVILGQMLPAGTVVKGGTSLRLRFGPGKSRVTIAWRFATRQFACPRSDRFAAHHAERAIRYRSDCGYLPQAVQLSKTAPMARQCCEGRWLG